MNSKKFIQENISYKRKMSPSTKPSNASEILGSTNWSPKVLKISIASIIVDGSWWRHEAPSAVEMMEEAWKSGRQVRRLLVAMDR